MPFAFSYFVQFESLELVLITGSKWCEVLKLDFETGLQNTNVTNSKLQIYCPQTHHFYITVCIWKLKGLASTYLRRLEILHNYNIVGVLCEFYHNLPISLNELQLHNNNIFNTTACNLNLRIINLSHEKELANYSPSTSRNTLSMIQDLTPKDYTTVSKGTSESTAYLKFAKLQYVFSGFRCRVITGSLMRLH